ncbi:trithorax group protein osa-like isoform X2 [Ornithodoros turicata]
MAAPAQGLLNCEQKTADGTDLQSSAASGGLKNGASGEDLSADEMPVNVMVNNRVKSPSSVSGHIGRELTMDNFQDGGTHQLNARPSAGDQASFSDRQRLNSDFRNYSQNMRESAMVSEEFRNSPDSMNHVPVGNYGAGYGERGGYMASQHGGQNLPGNASESPQNKLYQHYNQQHMRPGYPPGARGPIGPMGSPQRPGSAGMMSCYPANGSSAAASAQQRFLSGPSINQQGGPTPTLNQLLQSPNPLHRYQNSYADYNSSPGMHKGMTGGDVSQAAQYPSSVNSPHSWGGAVRASSPYPQQISAPMYRPPVGGGIHESSGGAGPAKRPYMSGGPPASPQYSSQYPQQRPYPGASQQQVPRPPSMPQGSYGQASQMGGAYQPSSGVPQQHPAASPSPVSCPPAASPQPSPQPQVTPPPSSAGPASPQGPPSSQGTQNSHPPSGFYPPSQSSVQTGGGGGSSSSAGSTSQQKHSSQQSDVNVQEEEGSAGGGGGRSSTPVPLRGAAGTPPSTPHPGVSPLRPIPSPSGSSSGGGSGSRSMSPAIGAQSNIPMPPRPSSSQSDGSAPNHLTQPQLPQQGGYNQQVQASAMYGSKMHQGIMPSYPGPHYPQGNYPRQQQQPGGGSLGMGSYMAGGPQAGPGGYLGRPGPQGGPAGYPGGPPYANAHYGAPAGYAANHGANSMMPPPSQYPKGTAGQQVGGPMGPGGGPPRPMYLRQHLQQKMYGYASPMTPPGGDGRASSPSEGGPTPNSVSSGAGYAQCSTAMSTPSLLTQSVNSPVSTPSSLSGDGGGSRLGPPPVLDEGSQASNASASSSLPEEHGGGVPGGGDPMAKANSKQPPVSSHPPTPNTLPSPGGASMSSFHDEFDSVSSPSWPRTPASPVVNSQVYEHHMIKRPDGLLKLYDMSDDPERRAFLDKLIMYNDERGTPITQCPTISKQPLDLFRLYLIVKDRGGFVEVTKAKQWKDVAGVLGIGASSSAAYTLRKQYIKHLLPFECKFDRGGIDPQPIISQLESASRKKAKATMAASAAGQDYGPPSQPMDNYGGGYPGGGYPHHGGPGAPPHPAMMGGPPEYPCPPGYPPPHANHVGASGGDSSADGYPTDEGPYPDQYPQYPQGPPVAPPYSASQSSMSGGSCGYPTGGDQYPGDGQYSQAPHGGPPDPYGGSGGPQPPAGYPPRSMGQGGHQYGQYQGPYDRERYEQQQQQQTVCGQPPSRPPQGDAFPYGGSPGGSAGTPPGAAGTAAAVASGASSYQSRPYPPQGPSYPPQGGPQGVQQPQQGQPQEPYQRPPPSEPSGYQVYGGAQSGTLYGGGAQGPPPGGKVPPGGAAPYQRDMYPKRHPDFMKPPQEPPYSHMGTYPPQQQPQQYPTDRSQYPYRPPHMMTPPASSMQQQGWGREGQYRGYQGAPPQVGPGGPYGASHPGGPDRWDGPRMGEGPAPSGGWAMSRGPQGEAGSYGGPMASQHAMPSHKGPPYPRDARGFAPPGKMPLGGQYGSAAVRKEVVFPPDSVEAVLPVSTKRRRLTSKDVSPLEAWRLLMALKSGLLAESSWALDVLAVLLFDDSTVLYFGLSHLPGLLETLIEHFRRLLALVFNIADDLELGYESKPPVVSARQPERLWYLLDRDTPLCDPLEELLKPVSLDCDDRTVLLSGSNFTNKTRCGKAVRTRQDAASLHVADPDKQWDVYEGFSATVEHWQLGGGEITSHVQTCFESDETNVRFVRIMEGVKKEDTEEQSKCSEDAKLEELLQECKGFKVNCRKEIVLSAEQLAEKVKVEKETDECKDNKKEMDECKAEEEEENKESEDSKEEEEGFPRVRTGARKRRGPSEEEEESYARDEPSLCVVSEAQDALGRRCVCISTILRNLSFVPGNDAEMSKHSGLLVLLGRLLLLRHAHGPRRRPPPHYEAAEEATAGEEQCSSLVAHREWWWDSLQSLRENTLVCLANVAGQLDLAPYPEEVSLPILDGLLHWAVCPSAAARDPLPQSSLSPQRLALEALCKLSVQEANVDLLLATPPWNRTERLLGQLARWLARGQDQVLREFAVVLLSNLAPSGSGAARAVAMQNQCPAHLLAFVEQAEQSALQVANSQGVAALRENPELMGTTLDMVRRAAATLRCLARVPDNRSLFAPLQSRLLALVMSQILDQGVAALLADVLYECSQPVRDPIHISEGS